MTVRDDLGFNKVNGDVGIEVEIEGPGLLAISQKPPPNWKVKTDGSLRGENAEFIIDKPVKLDKVRLNLEKLVASVRAEVYASWRPSERTGVHVHINVLDMEQYDVFKYACLYLALEGVLIHYCGPERTGNPFCLSIQDAEDLTVKLCQMGRKGNIYHSLPDRYRYSAVNLASVTKFGSLEFRSMRTPPLDEVVNVIEDWATMLYRMKEASLQYQDPRDIVEGMSAAGADRFLEEIFGDKFHLLRGPATEQLLMDGVRQMQDIAYSGWFQKEEAGLEPQPFFDQEEELVRPRLLRVEPEALNWRPMREAYPREPDQDGNREPQVGENQRHAPRFWREEVEALEAHQRRAAEREFRDLLRRQQEDRARIRGEREE